MAAAEAEADDQQERARSPASVEDDDWSCKYSTFNITLKVAKPSASRTYLLAAFRGTDVAVGDLQNPGEDDECFAVRLSCSEGENTSVKFTQRNPNDTFIVSPGEQAIDDVGVELHLTTDCLDPVRINFAENGWQISDKNCARTVMFRDFEYVSNTTSRTWPPSQLLL